MDRRNFLKASCALSGIVGVVAILESCSKKNTTQTSPQGPSVNFTLDLSQPANSALNTSGNSGVTQGVLVINTGGTFIALADTCTHAGCGVAYSASSNNLVCPCHGGTFDINGNVTGGPPPSPLKKYTVTRSGNTLTVSG
jgi:Rieske Fe-S protein